MKNEYYLTAEAYERSIRIALSANFNVEDSLKRLHSALQKAPQETLHIKFNKGAYDFYSYSKGKRTYLHKQSNMLYILARKKYYKLLFNVLKAKRTHETASREFEDEFSKLIDFTRRLYGGNIDLARVAFTKKQYSWFTRNNPVKKLEAVDVAGTTGYGVKMRSKSEVSIGNALESFGVPYIYELQMKIQVQPLVVALENNLKKIGFPTTMLYSIGGRPCIWNVPKNLEWMNNPGSIWRSYFYRDGTVTIHPDFSIMLRNGELIVWEHEGIIDNFDYRCNASERVTVMKQAGAVKRTNIIETYESDVADANAISEIICNQILPRLWF